MTDPEKMSPTTMPDRPAFRNVETSNEDVDRAPISMLGVAALAIGVFSLVAPFSIVLLPLSIIAMAVGAVVLWRIGRDDSVRGRRLAQAGLGLGVVSCVWGLTATAGKTAYLHREAGKNAKVYLDTLAHGKIYEALELHVPKANRQIAGTDLAAHYQSKTGEMADLALEIIQSPSTQAVIHMGPQADWQLARGLDIQTTKSLQTINVEMHNRANPSDVAKVTLSRRFYEEAGQPVGIWNVERIEVSSADLPASSLSTVQQL